MPRAIDSLLRWCERVLVVTGLSALVMTYGFLLTPFLTMCVRVAQEGVVWGLLAIALLRFGLLPQRRDFLKRRPLPTLVTMVMLGLMVTRITLDPQRHAWTMACLQGFILLIALRDGAYASRTVTTWSVRPAQLLALSFVALIMVGTLLLMLPQATTRPGGLSLLPALFTATSAVCVTGLAVVDTATAFTPLGQGIILGLCQLGALGILTFAAVFSLVMHGDIGIREKMVLHDAVAGQQLGEISTTVRRIVWLTLLIEALGALSLFISWQHIESAPGTRLWHAIFHAVSAFCNAGFSTFSDSLAGPSMAMHVASNITLMLLIVLGGMGFAVLWEGLRWVPGIAVKRPLRLSVQSRLVWLTSGLLIVFGMIGFAVLESHGVFAERPAGERLLGALFQSVTARTAGFNTVAIGQLTTPATLFMMLLMAIGASPGSTGGGMKTTTVTVLLLSTVAIIRGQTRVEVLRRTLPWVVIHQAYATFFFFIATITLALLILVITETHAFLDLFFEEVSAFATVGLSRGITASLSNVGQGVIIMSMFVGRVGSLTLAVALARQVRTTAYEYPSERVMIG